MTGGLRIDPRFTEYQASFLRRLAHTVAPGGSLLLSGPVGGGKSFAVAGSIAELMRMRSARRVLLLTQEPLRLHWTILATKWDQEALALDARILRELRASSRGSGVWPEGWYVASMDFAKRADAMAAIISSEWDFLIVDEAHVVSGRRLEFVERLLQRPSKPFTLFITPSPESCSRIAAGAEMIDWTKDIAALRAQQSSEVTVRQFDAAWHRAESEQSLARLVMKCAARLGPPVGPTLLLRAASSIAALEKSLVRLTMDHEARVGHSDLTVALEQTEELEVDSKLACLLNLVRTFGSKSQMSAIIFTAYRDSLDYISANLADEGYPVYSLSGEVAGSTAKAVTDEFEQEGGVLVTTSVYGLPVNFVRQVVHFDLPVSPTAFARRVGRYNRYGRTNDCSVYTLRDDSGAFPPEGLIYRMATEPDFASSKPGRDLAYRGLLDLVADDSHFEQGVKD